MVVRCGSRESKCSMFYKKVVEERSRAIEESWEQKIT